MNFPEQEKNENAKVRKDFPLKKTAPGWRNDSRDDSQELNQDHQYNNETKINEDYNSNNNSLLTPQTSSGISPQSENSEKNYNPIYNPKWILAFIFGILAIFKGIPITLEIIDLIRIEINQDQNNNGTE